MRSLPTTRNESGRARILVVEDERLVALDIQRTLIELGYTVAGSAAKGKEAVQKAWTERPDLILMDIRLRGDMDGIEAATEIQKEMEIPVIYLSAFSDAETVRRARSSAPFGFLIKPFKRAELVCAVEVALGRWLVNARARERQAVTRGTEEISMSRLEELLGSTLLQPPPLALDGSREHASWSAESALDPRELELPAGPSLSSSRTPTGSVVLLGGGVPQMLDLVAAADRAAVSEADAAMDPARTQEMSVGEETVRPELAVPTVEVPREDRDRLQDRLETLSAVTGSLAHEFNNILATVLVNGQLLLERMESDDPRCAEVEEICRAAERGATVTQKLLAFGRRQILRPSLLDLSAVVHAMDKMLRGLVGPEIDLVPRLAPGLDAVKADREQIEVLMTNIVVNACEAMPAGGRLVIETANVEVQQLTTVGQVQVVPGPHVLFTVRDSGCGMDAETRRRAFEPFFTTKDCGRGTGLGLSTAYSIVDQNGGYICLQSEPGRGTVVQVYLPRAEPGAVVEPIAVTGLSLAGCETILLVEDDAGVRNAIAKTLLARGYRVLAARTGEEALELARRHDGAIELILSDLVVPDLSGPELVAQLRALDPRPSALFMSGYTDHAVLRDGPLSEGVEFLQKPFTPDVLLGKVRELLDREPKGPAPERKPG